MAAQDDIMVDRDIPTEVLNNLDLDSPRDEDRSETSSLTMSGEASIISKYLQDKERECEVDVALQRTEPLTLLELPVDVLRLIVKEITHTNDLTSLALTNSTLHNLAVPHIYARFDIVWPDSSMATTESKSVDALTYGLSTLCLGSSFARTTRRMFPKNGNGSPGPMSKFAGNDYAKYTRKFSLGNGPGEWVTEYMITKEGGKMLGTMVALAIAKMVNLETFMWDMPTGVLADIFMALSSLPEDSEHGECNLERVWIRWHDNHDPGIPSSPNPSPAPPAQPAAVIPSGSTLTPIGISLPPTASHPTPKPPISYSESQVEYPTFSVLPPLKSLTVLDIDELAYLDEMSVLIERSKDRLQELRIGISNKAANKDFVQTWDGDELHQVDHDARWPGENTIGERRLGGVLGVLVGRIYDIRRKPTKTKKVTFSPLPPTNIDSALQSPQTAVTGSLATPAFVTSPSASSPPLYIAGSVPPTPLDATKTSSRRSTSLKSGGSEVESPGRQRLEGKLKLKTLELERIPLSMQVCAKAFDWTVLTNLTILECAQHENLWKLLKRQFAPTPREIGFGISPSSSRPAPNAPLQYQLNLKRIHTDITSPSLISFIKETLAPNTLEILFLQDRRRGNANSAQPPVTIDAIFKGALKRHRSSLRKLLLDSSAKSFKVMPPATSPPDNMRWRHWCLTTEILQYVTSGRMSNLRELAVSIEYKDWHVFLQRLPNMPQLRSLNIPNIAEHVIRDAEPKELALQIADIITLRPEIQLCYLGISTKCFEILEARSSDTTGTGLNGSGGPLNPVLGDHHTHAAPIVEDATDDGDNDTTDDDDNDDDDDDEETEDDDEGTPTSPTDADETQSEHSDGDSDDDSFVEHENPRLRLREILFYDDKVAIFKARHGEL